MQAFVESIAPSIITKVTDIQSSRCRHRAHEDGEHYEDEVVRPPASSLTVLYPGRLMAIQCVCALDNTQLVATQGVTALITNSWSIPRWLL